MPSSPPKKALVPRAASLSKQKVERWGEALTLAEVVLSPVAVGDNAPCVAEIRAGL